MANPSAIKAIQSLYLGGTMNSVMMRKNIASEVSEGMACKFHDTFYANSLEVDGKVMPASGTKIFIEAAFTFSDENKWEIGEIKDINIFFLYVFDGSNTSEVKVTNEVAIGILDKIRPLIVFDRFFDGTKVIKKQA